MNTRGISTERGEQADCRVGSRRLPTSVHDATHTEQYCPQSVEVEQQQAPEAAAAATDVTGARAGPRPARGPLPPTAPLVHRCSVNSEPSPG
ncbi:unnamed protein product [Parnassius apollo]|uniref:(apollo) hypothetical protein n=1 Tax=Parnassius apollo TaxID=110799 RepID=A0A8S3XJF4_PARAO|nr:unnamed protein product [Parnassius apollo]